MFLFGSWGVWVWVYVLAFFFLLVFTRGISWPLGWHAVRQNQTSDLWIGWAGYPDQGFWLFPLPPGLRGFCSFWWAFLHCLWIRSVWTDCDTCQSPPVSPLPSLGCWVPPSSPLDPKYFTLLYWRQNCLTMESETGERVGGSWALCIPVFYLVWETITEFHSDPGNGGNAEPRSPDPSTATIFG